MIPTYSPAAHYWVVGADEVRLWSSAAKTYVASDAAAYAAWVAGGGRPTRIADEADLRDVLAQAGCPDRAPGYVPSPVALWQARAALAVAGRLDDATAAVNAAGGAVKEAWEYGNFIHRDSPTIEQLGAALGMTSDDIDNLFRAAAALEV